jgi:mRNA interferase MazF
LTTSEPVISRGEVWFVNFDPTVGAEIQKTRPAAVISISAAFRHRLRIVVPITAWQTRFARDFWMILLPATPANGLDKDSAANAYQLKSVSEDRFIRKIGVLTAGQMDEITEAIAVCIGYNP